MEPTFKVEKMVEEPVINWHYDEYRHRVIMSTTLVVRYFIYLPTSFAPSPPAPSSTYAPVSEDSVGDPPHVYLNRRLYCPRPLSQPFLVESYESDPSEARTSVGSRQLGQPPEDAPAITPRAPRIVRRGRGACSSSRGRGQ